MKRFIRLFEKEATLFSVVVFWLSLAVISFLFLTDDSDTEDLFAEKFGTVTYAKSSVKRKKSSKFRWFTVDQSSSVAVNDSIKTGPESAAIIEMEKGGTIEVGENSLIILRDTASISNNFIQGSLIIRDSKGDRRINVDESGKITEEKLSYRWVEPILQQEYVAIAQKPLRLNFKWTELSKQTQDSELTFEVSTRSAFSPDTTQSVVLASSERNYIQDLLPGRYFYRLKSSDGKALTETRVVKITELNPLNVSPQNVSTFGTRASMTISWSIPKSVQTLYASGTHTLEVSTDEEFLNIVSSQEVAPLSGQASLKDLSLGRYFARIRSKIRSFEFSGSVALLGLFQTQKMKINPLFPQRAEVVDMSKPVGFQWASDPKTADQIRYEFLLKDEQGEVLRETLSEYRYVWTPQREGRYSYVVSAYLGAERIAESKEVSFTAVVPRNIVLKSPSKGQELVSWPDSNTIKFQWSGSSKKKYEAFIIEFSRTEGFERIEASQTLDTSSFALPFKNIKEGIYYWRILAQASDGSKEQSKISSFKYSYPSPLAATSIRGLKKQYNLSKEKLSEVKWKEVKNAQVYEIEIVNESGRSPASIASHKTKSREWALPNLKEGVYSINVWAIDPAERRGQVSRQKFQVMYGDLLKAPKLKKVEVE